MSKEHQSVENAYAQAKQGSWEQILSIWHSDQHFAAGCSRYLNPFSGWTFLHQAARFGDDTVCRELIRLGAAIEALTYEDESPADVATKHHHYRLASTLKQASLDINEGWCPPRNPKLLPSSCHWDEAQVRKASKAMCVAYSGAVIKIPAGSRYFVDSFERTLIGWHGTYDPPSGMGCESMVSESLL